jgi:hypothetical protein
VTTQRFLEVFALGSLRDLPDLDTLEVPSAPQRERDEEIEAALDDAFGLDDEESADENDDAFDTLELEKESASFRFGWLKAFGRSGPGG